jgi:hypothetical protein
MESNHLSGGLLRRAGFEDRMGIRLVQAEWCRTQTVSKTVRGLLGLSGFESLPSLDGQIACIPGDSPVAAANLAVEQERPMPSSSAMLRWCGRLGQAGQDRQALGVRGHV